MDHEGSLCNAVSMDISSNILEVGFSMLSHLDERARAPYPLLKQSLNAAVPGRGCSLVQSSSLHQREPRGADCPQHPSSWRYQTRRTEKGSDQHHRKQVEQAFGGFICSFRKYLLHHLSGHSPRGGNGNPLQHSCLENFTEEPGRLSSL